MFLVDHDQAESGQRREHRRARAEHDARACPVRARARPPGARRRSSPECSTAMSHVQALAKAFAPAAASARSRAPAPARRRRARACAPRTAGRPRSCRCRSRPAAPRPRTGRPWRRSAPRPHSARWTVPACRAAPGLAPAATRHRLARARLTARWRTCRSRGSIHPRSASARAGSRQRPSRCSDRRAPAMPARLRRQQREQRLLPGRAARRAPAPAPAVPPRVARQRSTRAAGRRPVAQGLGQGGGDHLAERMVVVVGGPAQQLHQRAHRAAAVASSTSCTDLSALARTEG